MRLRGEPELAFTRIDIDTSLVVRESTAPPRKLVGEWARKFQSDKRTLTRKLRPLTLWHTMRRTRSHRRRAGGGQAIAPPCRCVSW